MIEDVMAKIQDCVRKMEERQNQISELQREKQKYIWDILNNTIIKKKESDAQVQRQLSRSKSLVGPTTPPFPLAAPSPSGTQGPVFEPQTDMQESMSIMNQSMQMHSDFDTIMRSVSEEQRQQAEELNSLNWGHLDGT
eukprot:XP_011666079.1 PREDICTED: uncharacterized protein LOC105439136 [Strongylocentrotus purpuratus]